MTRWRNRNDNNLMFAHPDKGCVYAPSCLKCPYPLFNGKCLNDLSEKERQRYLKEDADNH